MLVHDYPLVNYKKISPTAKTPHKAHMSDAAFDLFSDEEVEIEPGQNRLVGTGIALDMSVGLTSHYATVMSRSGLASKNQIFVLNSPGLIDNGYRGEIKVILQNLGRDSYRVERGERIAQIMFIPNYVVHLHEVEELSESDRGEKGFGSSGKK